MTSLLRLGDETLQVTSLTHNVMLSMDSFFLMLEYKFLNKITLLYDLCTR